MNSPAPAQERLETVTQAAERLAVNPLTVRRMIARGELAAVRVGPKLVRVRRADVDALIRGEGRG